MVDVRVSNFSATAPADAAASASVPNSLLIVEAAVKEIVDALDAAPSREMPLPGLRALPSFAVVVHSEGTCCTDSTVAEEYTATKKHTANALAPAATPHSYRGITLSRRQFAALHKADAADLTKYIDSANAYALRQLRPPYLLTGSAEGFLLAEKI